MVIKLCFHQTKNPQQQPRVSGPVVVERSRSGALPREVKGSRANSGGCCS